MPGSAGGDRTSAVTTPPAASPVQLLAALAALPAGHPSRPARREQVIEAWLPMARRLASRYCGRGEPTDDLVQTAVEGLIKAVDKFDPDRGIEFVGYAIPTIVGEIKRYFRDRTWALRVPRRLQEMRLAITAANNELTHTLGRLPTVADIAVHLRLTEEQVLEGLEGARAYTATSLSAPVGPAGERELSETIGTDDHEYELVDARAALGTAMAALGERDRRILTLRFYGNLSQTEIARLVGISQMHVSRLIARSLDRLRREIDPDTR
jgi:RNA polymerase sigma-B factor